MTLQQNGSIRITSEELYNGMSRSPYIGIQQMVNLDIHSKPGAVQIMKSLEAETVTGLEGKLRFGGIEYSTGNFYGLDQDGNLLERTPGGVWSDANDFDTTKDGCFVWKNYAIVLRNGISALLQAYGPITGGSPAERSFTSISFDHDLTAPFITYIDLDDRVFIGNDNVLHELIQVDGQDFDPTDSNTYSLSEQVLILPEGFQIRAITEIGTDLVIGTSYGNTNITADLFIWNPNKSGTGSTSPDQRIPLGGAGVRQLGYIDNIIYAVIGLEGSFKATDLTSIDKLFEFNNLLNDSDTDLSFTLPGESVTTHDGGLVIGLSKDGSAEPNLLFWKDSKLTMFTTSEGQLDGGIRIGKVQSLSNDELLVGWEDVADSSYGVDVTGTNRYSNYSAYFISQLYTPGRHMREKTYQYMGFTLGKNLTSGQGIRVKYREGLGEDWTIVNTWDYDTLGGVSAYEADANLPTNLTNVQFRVELTSTDTTSPELTSFYVM